VQLRCSRAERGNRAGVPKAVRSQCLALARYSSRSYVTPAIIRVPVTVYVTREFARFQRRSKLSAPELVEAAERVREGRWDADLGGGLFKQRIARRGGGKSGGYRTILCFRRGSHVFFIHGFAKNEKENVSQRELQGLKRFSSALLALNQEQITLALRNNELIEVTSRDS
jgi:hypothetical protein